MAQDTKRSAYGVWFDEYTKLLQFYDDKKVTGAAELQQLGEHISSITTAANNARRSRSRYVLPQPTEIDEDGLIIDREMSQSLTMLRERNAEVQQHANNWNAAMKSSQPVSPTQATLYAEALKSMLNMVAEPPSFESIFQTLSMRRRLKQLAAATSVSDAEARSTLELLKEIHRATTAEADRAATAAAAAEKASGIGGTQVLSFRYGDVAKELERAAIAWLVLAGLLAVAAVCIVWYANPQAAHVSIPNTATPAVLTLLVIRLFAAKVATFSLALFCLTVCVRNYQTNKHNAEIYRHRASVFKTYEAFVASAKSKTTKDLVLTQALQLLLSHQPTGYLGAVPDATPAGQASRILDLAKKLKDDADPLGGDDD